MKPSKIEQRIGGSRQNKEPQPKPTTQRPTPIGDFEIEQRGESKQKGEKKKPVKEISDGREEIGGGSYS